MTAPTPGKPRTLEDGLTCVLAPNPSPMTHWGTNTYLLGWDSVAVIDPGPADPDHLGALLRAIGGRRVSHILVTHSHLDHSPLAGPLAEAVGAPVLAFGDSGAGRSAIMETLARAGEIGGGEGVDRAFTPHEMLTDGATVRGEGWHMTAHHTPGHFGNHMCFQWGEVGFTGDHVMGWASSLVSPPDGDLTDFMASCVRLQNTGITRAYAGHGAPIADAHARIAALIDHRRTREDQILTALRDGPMTAHALAGSIYTETPKALLGAAARNVLAHLIDLTQRAKVGPIGPLRSAASFALQADEKSCKTP